MRCTQAGLLDQEHLALAGHRAHDADLAVWAPGRAQQSKAHELLQPLAVLHVALAPGDVLQLPRIDQPNLQPTLLQDFEHRNPVHAGRLQRHGIDTARQQPVGQRVQVISHRAKFMHRFLGQMRWHRHPMARCPDINSARIGKHLVVSLAHRHGLLHYR
jgi:hypothetical protein